MCSVLVVYRQDFTAKLLGLLESSNASPTKLTLPLSTKPYFLIGYGPRDRSLFISVISSLLPSSCRRCVSSSSSLLFFVVVIVCCSSLCLLFFVVTVVHRNRLLLSFVVCS